MGEEALGEIEDADEAIAETPTDRDALGRRRRGSVTEIEYGVVWGKPAAVKQRRERQGDVSDHVILGIAREAADRAPKWAMVRSWKPNEDNAEGRGRAQHNAVAFAAQVRLRLKKKPLVDLLPPLLAEVKAAPPELPSGAPDMSGKYGVFIRFGGETGKERKPRG